MNPWLFSDLHQLPKENSAKHSFRITQGLVKHLRIKISDIKVNVSFAENVKVILVLMRVY